MLARTSLTHYFTVLLSCVVSYFVLPRAKVNGGYTSNSRSLMCMREIDHVLEATDSQRRDSITSHLLIGPTF